MKIPSSLKINAEEISENTLPNKSIERFMTSFGMFEWRECDCLKSVDILLVYSSNYFLEAYIMKYHEK